MPVLTAALKKFAREAISLLISHGIGLLTASWVVIWRIACLDRPIETMHGVTQVML